MVKDPEQFFTFISEKLSQHDDPFLKHTVTGAISPESNLVPE